ncbi:MAG TPA: ATP phosphoribosyltransferase [Clostridiales bacterium]|nr:MAG: ATP phosphoribosyltransferase [Firmicutes bacterium ADurb.Bin262]HOU11257.1 ATP phosphoribosyltransferase [Clostridiales bacterium]HQH62878.1 ATP phosphoribosyltransferase [Clostridiales bacterium]HQK73535.1 ATP phosphoribosyltransferase [Clostridiales bacterium]
MRPLRIAVTKGRLEKKAANLFTTMGLDCARFNAKGRKLIVPVDDYEVVIAKAADVITYVEQGACDIGIVGKDTIVEYAAEIYETTDLGFGKCFFALAAEKGKHFYEGYNKKVIATKYPNVARKFFEGKGMDVRIIKIEGSVELAPLLGLADAIVDIVETGTTLRENGLEVVEEIMPVSARIIVNIASMKMRKEEIESFLADAETAKEFIE